MIRFAADEDFNNDVVRALRRALSEVNILGVREAGRGGQPDPEVLAWAAAEARALLTHDVTTMTRHALERFARGEPMPGVIAVHQRLPIGDVVDDLLLVASCSVPDLLLLDPLVWRITLRMNRSAVPCMHLSTNLPDEYDPTILPWSSARQPGGQTNLSKLSRRLSWERVRLAGWLKHRWRLPVESDTLDLSDAPELVRKTGWPSGWCQLRALHKPALGVPELVMCPAAFEFPQKLGRTPVEFELDGRSLPGKVVQLDGLARPSQDDVIVAPGLIGQRDPIPASADPYKVTVSVPALSRVAAGECNLGRSGEVTFE